MVSDCGKVPGAWTTDADSGLTMMRVEFAGLNLVGLVEQIHEQHPDRPGEREAAPLRSTLRYPLGDAFQG